MYRYLIYDKDDTAEDQKKDFSVNGAGTMRYLYEKKKKMKWIPTSYSTQKSIPDGFKPKCERQNNKFFRIQENIFIILEEGNNRETHSN